MFPEQLTNLFISKESIVTLCLAFVILLIWKYISENRNLPPGPWGLPLFGYLFFLGRKPHETLAKLVKKYGPIFSIRLGNRLAIVLGSHETIAEAFIKQGGNFSGRPLMKNIIKEDQPFKGFGMAEGGVWKAHRRFVFNLLRDFGIGNSRLEPVIKEEIDCFLQYVETTKGQAVDISDELQVSVARVVCIFIFGQRVDSKNEEFRSLIKLMSEHSRNSRLTGLEDFLPWLFKIPVIKTYLKSKSPAETTAVKIMERVEKLIQENLKPRVVGIGSEFLDKWIKKSQTGPEKEYFIHENLAPTVRQIIIAGLDTTSTTLLWAFLYLMINEDVQRRLQSEIDDVVGQDRTPAMSDTSRMPYSMAVLLEILRISSIFAFSATHSNFEETTLCGYRIPKRTYVFPHLWMVHHDPDKFLSPNEFRPDRFLDKEGKICNEDSIIPFSIGKRQCVGETLARTELFLFLTSVFQKFTIKAPPNASLSLESIYSLILGPQPFKLCATLRHTVHNK